MKRLLLVRHGQTEWNALRRLQGQTDIALTPEGETQARALAPLIADLAPDRALSSDLARAMHTAALLGHEDATPEPRLREQDLGAWSGRDIADLLRDVPTEYHEWRAGRFTPKGGEVWPDFRARVESAIADALAEGAATTLLVCHGGVIRAALDALLDLPPNRVIPVGPASLTILARPDTGLRLEAFNLRNTTPDLDAPD